MSRQPLPADTILGQDSDQYKIDTVLGPGGFGVTYLARSLRLDREVAIKEYFPAEFAYRDGSTTIRSSASSSSDFFNQGKRYFIEEARVLGRFRHEHIVRVIGLLEENNTAYMILEFEEGQSFKQWLRELGHKPTQDEVDGILEPMLSALDYIHGKGIFHRDIAPDNIIVRPDGKPVLIDFGAARQFARESSHTLGAIVKHGYSPPEQYTVDTRLQGAWSDIYALSATMYHAIMGQAPEEASKRQLNDTMLPIEEHMDAFNRTLYHPSFLRGLNAGLTLRPKDRPQTVSALRAILHEGRDIGQQRSEPVRTGGRATGPASAGAAGQQSLPVGTVLQSLSSPAGVAGSVPYGAAQAAEARPRSWISSRLIGAHAATALLALVALVAVAFRMTGGTGYDPNGLPVILLICLGLCAAAIERGYALFRDGAAGHAASATITQAATVSALAFAVFWLQLWPMPIWLPFAALGLAYAYLGFGSWVPLTLGAVALPHLALAFYMLMGAHVHIARADGASVHPYIWPLLACSLAIVSGLALASAIQMRRRTADEARA